MGTLLKTEKLAGGSTKEVVRRVKRIVTELPDGKPPSHYIEQEDVTYVDGERIGATGVEPAAIGETDVADDDHVEAFSAMQEVFAKRIQTNAINKQAREDVKAANIKAAAARADLEDVAVPE